MTPATLATLIVDVALALVAAALLLIVSPGLAVVGLIALLVLLVCGVSLLFDVRRSRRRRRVRPASRSPRRL